MRTHGPLTTREIEVVRRIHAGERNKEIAAQLNLSELTVKTYVYGIFRKLNLTSRTQVALWAGRALGVFLLAVSLHAQTPGTVTTLTTVTINATIGTSQTPLLSCNFTGNAVANQITISCTGAGATLTSTLPLPLPSPGTVGNFSLSGNTITWGFSPAGSGAAICPPGTTTGTCWQVVANGTAKTGAF